MLGSHFLGVWFISSCWVYPIEYIQCGKVSPLMLVNIIKYIMQESSLVLLATTLLGHLIIFPFCWAASNFMFMILIWALSLWARLTTVVTCSGHMHFVLPCGTRMKPIYIHLATRRRGSRSPPGPCSLPPSPSRSPSPRWTMFGNVRGLKMPFRGTSPTAEGGKGFASKAPDCWTILQSRKCKCPIMSPSVHPTRVDYVRVFPQPTCPYWAVLTVYKRI